MKSLLLFALLALLPLRASTAATVYVDTDTTIVPSYWGAGVQWDPSDRWDYTPAQWKMIDRRVDYLRPSFIRCCLSAGDYCTGFDAHGDPTYNWDSPVMKRLTHILAYCQAQHIDVLLGEWGPPFGMAWDDPRWSRLIGDCLEHLIRTQGYTCIKFYNKINEPRGDRAQFALWVRAQKSLAVELDKRGLSCQVTIVGPDHSEGRSAFEWVDWMTKDAPNVAGAYETHWYASIGGEIQSGALETALRSARQTISAQDPHGREKRFFLGESGTADWVNGDNNRYIRDFGYGVFMADYFAQTTRAGLDGQSVWDLDDSMHQNNDPGTHGVPAEYDFKTWGFWNTMGAAMGRPDDERLRPWYYTWALLSRSFPRGARIVRATDTHLPGIRTTAAVIPHGNKSDLSIALVNDAAAPRTFHVCIPNAGGATFAQYDYFDTDRPADADGFPVAKQRQTVANLKTGFDVSLPSQGVVILTTLDGGTPTTLGRGAHIPVSSITVRDPGETVPLGGTLAMTATVEPPGRPVVWSVRGTDGKPTNAAVIDAVGHLTGLKLGRVKVTAAASGVSGAMTVEITRDRIIVDPLDDWHETFAHTDGWLFDTANVGYFDSDPSRLKRASDTPQSVTYHMADLTDFTARIYFLGELGDKVTISASPDNAAWTPVAVTGTPPVVSGWQFKRTELRPVSLPPGTQYLKIEFAHDPNIFAPQLAEIRLVAAKPASVK